MRRQIQLADDAEMLRVLGVQDRNLKRIREHFGIRITARGQLLTLEGDEAVVDAVAEIVDELRAPGHTMERTEETLAVAIDRHERPAHTDDGSDGVGEGFGSRWGGLDLDEVARTDGQRIYLQAIARAPIVMAIGPAGTGKTFLAVRMAVQALKTGSVKKIVLCRPAVEAGEKLGFLPGDFQAKVNPYLRPLYDALNELLDYDQVRRYSDREIIEIAPLAFMRGRTLNRAFIILDEAQNTTRAQMKMFLTRMGMESRIVVNGDVTQIDLPHGQPSGLMHARRILGDIRGIEWVELTQHDIVRNPIVSRIVMAYDRHEGAATHSEAKPERPAPR